MSDPIYFPPAPFQLDQAVSCSKLVETAYSMYRQWLVAGKPRQSAEFSWQAPAGDGFEYSDPFWSTERAIFKLLNVSEPFGFVATETSSGKAYIVFRGTESEHDWFDDADADHVDYDLVAGFGSVHHGFFRLYKSLREDLLGKLAALPTLPAQLFITGHSLGSGLSTVAVPDIVNNTPVGTWGQSSIQHYNFACPRTAGPDLARQMKATAVPTYRVVNSEDLVPTLPPSQLGEKNFEHVGTQISFTAQYGSTGGNHSMTDCYSYAITHPDKPSSVG